MEGSQFIGALRNNKQIWLDIRWFMSNFMRSFEDIILGVVDCIGVKNFERPLIEIYSSLT